VDQLCAFVQSEGGAAETEDEEAIFMEAELPEEEEGNTMETPLDVEGDSM
jgi:hypothetical protein